MRVSYISAMCIAAIAGAACIGANAVGADPSAVNPLAAAGQLPRAFGLGGDGVSLKPGAGRPWSALGGSHGLSAPRRTSTQLAQVLPSVATPEATTGNPSLAPLKWVGLLVIPNPTPQDPGAGGYCTAQFIAPKVLLTAGHCIKDLQASPTGPWPDPTKGTFWLQYQAGGGIFFNIVCAEANPLWTFPANYASMTPDQQNAAFSAASEHDFAMLLVNNPSPTGVMQYALDWKGKVSSVVRVGYPEDILNGAIVQEVPGPIFFADAIPLGAVSVPNLVAQWGPVTDFTQGSSGGGWIANFSATESTTNNILIAVTSFNASSLPGAIFAAYLTAAEFNPLLTSVSNGCT